MARLQLDRDQRERCVTAPVRELDSPAIEKISTRGDFRKELERNGFSTYSRFPTTREDWNRFLGPKVTPANLLDKVFSSLELAKDPAPHTELTTMMGGSGLRVATHAAVLTKAGEKVGVDFHFILRADRTKALMEHMLVEETGQGNGIGSSVFRDALSFLRGQGVEQATMRVDKVGGYLWPLHKCLIKDLYEAEGVFSEDRGNSLGLRLDQLRTAVRAEKAGRLLSSDEREQTDAFVRGLDRADSYVRDGRQLIAAGDLGAVQGILPQLARLDVETPSFVTNRLSEKEEGIYDGMRPDTLAKALLCGISYEAVRSLDDIPMRPS